MLELTLSSVAVFATVIFVAALIRGYAGFGFSAIVVAAGSIYFPTKILVPVVICLEILASLQMFRRVWAQINWRLVITLLLGVMLLVPIGQIPLSHWPQSTVQSIIAGFLLLAVISIWRRYHPPIPNTLLGWFIIGSFAGLINGLAGMGGLIIMIAFLNSDLPAVTLRASMVAFLFCVDLYTLGISLNNALVTTNTLILVSIAVPFLIVGVGLGQRWYKPDQSEQYRRVALWVLFALAWILLLQPLAP